MACRLSPDRIADIINRPLNDERVYTFLHKYCDLSDFSFVEQLIKWGGDFLHHPSTHITALHVACQTSPNIPILDLILSKFPKLVLTTTSDGLLPIHVACLEGNTETVEKLLYHNYPKDLLTAQKFKSFRYYQAFNVNSLSSNGYSPMHLAVMNKHLKTVKALLNYNVQQVEDEDEIFCPVEKDSSLILLALKHSAGYEVIKCLLENGISPCTSTTKDGGNPPLMQAFNNMDVDLMDMLLEYGATDEHNEVLRKAITAMQSSLSSINQELIDELPCRNALSILVIRFSHIDRELRLSKRTMLDSYHELLSPDTEHNRSSKQIVHPVAINWHKLGLNWLQPSWFTNCAKRHNQGLIKDSAILATITRIDLSSNKLSFLPLCLFRLPSLKVLHLSNNNLVSLPETNISYDCLLLEELDLSKNSLKALPSHIFTLPNVKRMNVSGNCLESLPFAMWLAPKLEDFVASSNRLKTLPFERETNRASLTSLSDQDSPQLLNTMEDVKKRKSYCEEILTSISFWGSKIKVRNPVFDTDDSTLHLTNLDLSQNDFTSIPYCLPCLAPHLCKLNMSNNKLTEIGPLHRYPACLRELNLDNNHIDDSIIDDQCEEAEEDRCFSPNIGRLKLNNTPMKSPLRRNRICLHRTHEQLERLKLLRLSGNKLKRITLLKDISLCSPNSSRILKQV